MENFLLIDGSYYCFYRYYATLAWWNTIKKFSDDPKIKECENPIESPEFSCKFKELFIKKIHEFIRKLKIANPYVIVAKDCPRQQIWRNELHSTYKSTRVTDDGFMGGPFFKLAYQELFNDPLIKKVIFNQRLEADDCLAISTRWIKEHFPTAKITIVASDNDYLQLASDQVSIVNLKYKNIRESKTSFKNAEKDLFCKIVTGDKSDNIPGIFRKCGIKTAEKYFNDNDAFIKQLNIENADAVYARNKQLIDFNMIPVEYVNEVKQQLDELSIKLV